MSILTHTQLSSLPLLHQGKVRDIYDINEDKMLIVTTDRLSAFDVIMNEPIPFKGEILTKMANFWFSKLEAIGSTLAVIVAVNLNISASEIPPTPLANLAAVTAPSAILAVVTVASLGVPKSKTEPSI